MKKFECKGCGAWCVLITTLNYKPNICFRAEENWQEVKEEEQKLPKLTAEVFERPDCPEWANYAAVDVQGLAYWYQYPPLIDERIGSWKTLKNKRQMIDGFFDRTDWRDSFVERPAKEKALPDWVEECAIGYDCEQYRYFEITNVEENWIDIEYLDDGNGATCDYSDIQKCSEGRKRPFNAEEMRNLVGKKYESSCCTFLVMGYDKRKKSIKVNELWFNSEELMNGKNSINPPLIDGKPCGVLEHLENGEWVE